MKMYWWQGGLHLEPQGQEDTDALMRLWSAERIVPQASSSNGSAIGVLLEQVNDGLIVRK
jgi:hypothetical protein